MSLADAINMPQRGSFGRLWRAPLAWLLLGAAVVRGAALLAGSGALGEDRDDYRTLAQAVINHGSLAIGGNPTAYRPPLYPLVLAAWGAAFGLTVGAIGTLHWLIGIATVGLVVLVGRQWGLGRVAYLAGLLVAVDPILIHQSTQVMTETLATFLATAALWTLGAAGLRGTPRSALLAGLMLALATLCRPTFLLWGVAATLLLMVKRPAVQNTSSRKGLNPKYWSAIACAAGLALGLLPWGARNLVQLGRPIVTTTHGGFTLWLANNRDFYRYLRQGNWGEVWTSERLVERWQAELARQPAPNELDCDRLAYQLARHDILAEPAMFAYSCLVRGGRFWSVLPHQVAASEGATRRALRCLVGLGYAAEHLLFVVGLVVLVRCRNSNQCWHWGLLLMICVAGAHLLYWTDMRMRAPIVPAECLFAAAGIAHLASRSRRRKAL